MVKFRN